MKKIVKQGTTSKRLVIFVQDSSKTTGVGLTGLTNSSVGLTWYYYREDSSASAVISLVAETLGTWTSGGFVEIDATHLPGFYEIGVPNTVLAATNAPTWAYMQLQGGPNMVPVNIEIELVAYDPTDATHLGLSALPNAAAASAGGLPTSGAGANQIVLDGAGRVDVGQWLDVVPNGLTFGKLDADNIVFSGTAQGGGATSITLSAGASASNDFYKGLLVHAVAGGGADHQVRLITAYNGATKVATITPAWTNNPTSATTFIILPWGGVDVEMWQNTVVSTPSAAGVPDVNVKNYNNQTAQTDVNNLPKVDVVDIAGAAINTGAAQLGVNVVQYNAQTAQTDANNLPKVDLEDIKGVAVNTAAAQLGANVVQFAGAAAALDVNNLPKVDTEDWKGAAATAFPSNFSALSITSGGAVTLAVGQIAVKKNQALAGFTFPMVSSTTGQSLTGLSVTSIRSIDAGATAPTANSVVEVGSGIYSLNLAASDLNGNSITVKFSATGALDMFVTFVTQA